MIVHRGVMRRGDVINRLSDQIDQVAMIYYQSKEDTSDKVNYLEALTHTLASFHHDFDLRLNDEEALQVDEIFTSIDKGTYYEDEICSALLLLEIKALKHIRYPLDLITPDGVSVLCGMLLSPFIKQGEEVIILDPNYGMGNLIHTISYLYPDLPIHWIGIENHEPFVNYAIAKANFIGHELTLNFQDALEYNYPDIDLIISDLAIYDYDIENYHSPLAAQGVTYFPYLMIEKFLNSGKDSTKYFYIVDRDFLQHKGADRFKDVLMKQGHMEAIIGMPPDFFINHQNEKVILLISKRKTTEETEVHVLPSLKERERFEQTINKILTLLRRELK